MVICKSNFYILFFTLIIISCNQSDSFIEKKRVKEFVHLKKSLDSIIFFVNKKYYTIGNKGSYNRLQFVLGEESYQRANIISDSEITTLIKGSDITDIVFEKASQCLDRYTYDLVRFKIKSKGVLYQYYYVYEFCPMSPHDSIVDGTNYKSLPLGNNWYLEVEKN